MIKTRKDLKEYIEADFKRQGMSHPLLARLTYGEHDLTRRYMKNLRKLEYFSNNKSLFNKIFYFIYLLKHRRDSLKYGMYISPNTVEKGFLLPHPGFVRIDSFCHIGENCTILPMVLLGKKHPNFECVINVGKNCYISTGVTILGPITIGNNVTIAAGAVVTKDVPDNCLVGGVPAKIIKYKE